MMRAVSASDKERVRRLGMWTELTRRSNSAAVTPSLLDEVGLRPRQTGQGIYRAHSVTQKLAPPHGVTLALLDTGTIYPDAFDAEGGEYHYPRTERGVRDRNEVLATKQAAVLHLPVFVILPGVDARTRVVHLGWVADFDDASGTFYISFAEPSPDALTLARSEDAMPFELRTGRRPVALRAVTPRPGQARFSFRVFKRYGVQCALCDAAIREVLEAVHICPVADGGCDDPRNGLVLCRNHHRAFDAGMVYIDPETLTVASTRPSASLQALQITRRRLDALRHPPHREALIWRAKQRSE
jgi:putative restriction endonuclease